MRIASGHLRGTAHDLHFEQVSRTLPGSLRDYTISWSISQYAPHPVQSSSLPHVPADRLLKERGSISIIGRKL